MKEIRIPHIHCPVNGWDCPYYTDEGEAGRPGGLLNIYVMKKLLTS